MNMRTCAHLWIIGLGCLVVACGGSSNSLDPEPVPGFAVEESTIALWHLNEGTGGTATDASPNAYHLQLGPPAGSGLGPPVWVGAGHLGACLSFDSNEHGFAAGTHAVSLPTRQVSVELWHRTASTTGRVFELEPEVCLLGWAADHFYFGISDGGFLHVLNLLTVPVLNALTDGTWHYIAATYDGATMRLYVDGQEEANMAVNITPPVGSALVVGGRTGGSDTIDGEIDEVRISARAVSAGEIAAHWAVWAP